MLRSLICFFFATQLFVLSAFAAPVLLGPETPLAPSFDLGPAAFDQESPAVASNGRDFLAVWIDRRSAGVFAPLYATRVGPDGHPVDLLGQRLADTAQFPHVASNGGDYLIAYADGGSNVLRVDENGHPAGAARRLNTTREPRQIVSNGDTYLLIESQKNQQSAPPVAATLLDADGAPLLTVNRVFGALLWAGAYNGRYVVIDVPAGCTNGCQDAPRLSVISAQGAVLSSASLPFTPMHSEFIAAVASPDRVLLITYSSSIATAGNFLVADYEGHVVHPLLPVAGPTQTSESGVAWDGREFLMMYNEPLQLFARRVSPDGTFAGEPFALPSRVMPAVATNGSKLLLVRSDREFNIFTDVIGRAADSFAALAAAHDDDRLISYSPPAQYDVRVAAAGARTLAVWRDSNGALAGTLSGTPLSILPANSYTAANPSVAAGKQNFLVVWLQTVPWEIADIYQFKVMAVRIGFDGQILDSSPVTLATIPGSLGLKPGIAYDGTSFVVATSAANVLYVERVNDEGLIEEQRTIALQQGIPEFADPVAIGTRVVIPYALVPTRVGCDICDPRWSIGIDGLTLFENAGAGPSIRVAAATDGERVTLAWITYDGTASTLRVAQINSDAQVLTAPKTVRELPGLATASVDLAWNGAEYVAAWSDTTGHLRALRLNRAGDAIDNDPIDIVTQMPYALFSLARTAAGVAFGYDRLHPSSGNVTRAFLRLLDRASGAPPRRSVRH